MVLVSDNLDEHYRLLILSFFGISIEYGLYLYPESLLTMNTHSPAPEDISQSVNNNPESS